MESFLRAQYFGCHSLKHNPISSLFEFNNYQLATIYTRNLCSTVFMDDLVSMCVLAMRSQLFVAVLGIFFAREYFFASDVIRSEFA